MSEDNPYSLEECDAGELCDFHGRDVTHKGVTVRCFEYQHLCDHHKYIYQHQKAKEKAAEEAKKALEEERMKRELQEFQWHNPPYKPQLPGRQKLDLFEGRCWDWIIVSGGYHYVRDQEYFESYTPLQHATASGARIAGMGSVELEVLIDGPPRWLDNPSDKTHTFILGNVLHIPTAYNNGFVANLVCEGTKIRETWEDERVLQGYDGEGDIVFSAERMYGSGVDDIYARWGLCLPNELKGSPLAEMENENPQLDVELTNAEWNVLLAAETVESEDEALEIENEDMEVMTEEERVQNSQWNNADARKGLKHMAEDLEQQADENMEPAAKRLKHQGPSMVTKAIAGNTVSIVEELTDNLASMGGILR